MFSCKCKYCYSILEVEEDKFLYKKAVCPVCKQEIFLTPVEQFSHSAAEKQSHKKLLIIIGIIIFVFCILGGIGGIIIQKKAEEEERLLDQEYKRAMRRIDYQYNREIYQHKREMRDLQQKLRELDYDTDSYYY